MMGEDSVARPARLITLSREDARRLFAEGDPAGRWNVLMALQERFAEDAGRSLRLEPSWHLLQQALNDHAEQGGLLAARQLFAEGRRLPGLEAERGVTMMRPDLVPHAARELAGIVDGWSQDDPLRQMLRSVATLVDHAARDKYCLVFVSGV